MVAAVVHRQVEGDDRVASPLVLQREGGFIGGSGVADTVQIPDVAVASRNGFDTGVLVVDGEVESNDAVATLGGGQGVGVSATLGVGLAAYSPGVAVANGVFNCGGGRIVDRQIKVLLYRAVAAVVDICQHGGLAGDDGLTAPSDTRAFANLAVGVLDTHLLEGEGQVHQAVAAVGYGEVLVVTAVGGDGLLTPSVRIVGVADAQLVGEFVRRIDGDRRGAELVDASILVGDGDGIDSRIGGSGSGNSGCSTGVPAVAVAIDLGGGQSHNTIAADFADRSGCGNNRQLVDHNLDGGGSGASAGVIGGSRNSVGCCLGGIDGDAGGGGAGAPTIGGIDVVGISQRQRGALAEADLSVTADGQFGNRSGGDSHRSGQTGAAVSRLGGNHTINVSLVRVHNACIFSALILPFEGGAGVVATCKEAQVGIVAEGVNGCNLTVVVVDTSGRCGIDLQVQNTD